MSTAYVPNFDFLDDEERELAHLDPSTSLPEAQRVASIEQFRKAARSGKSKVISLRLDPLELERLKGRADSEGLPYQTMIQSILTKYLNGSLVDIRSVREVVKALK